MLKNPIIVVAVVRNTGQAFSRSDSAIAVSLSSPLLIPETIESTTWTECARATVMTMIGTPELAGLNTVPIQPANPRVVLTTNTMVTTSASVPNTERRSAAAATTMMTKTSGVRVRISSCVVSANARCMTTSPVRW